MIEQFPVLARQLGEAFFNEKLNPICLAWLKDQIFSIREAALVNFKQLTLVYGNQWAIKNVVPKIMWHHQDSNYLHRLTPLFFMVTMADSLGADIVKAHFVPVLKVLSKDKVANIRMNVAKSIHALGQHLKTQPSPQTAEVQALLKATLTELKSDEDSDVRYYAAKALSQI